MVKVTKEKESRRLEEVRPGLHSPVSGSTLGPTDGWRESVGARMVGAERDASIGITTLRMTLLLLPKNENDPPTHHPLTTHSPPPNFSWGDNHSKSLLNDF